MNAAAWEFNAESAGKAHAARREFSKFLRIACLPESEFEAAETIYGELVSNVIRHAPGPIQIRVEWLGGRAVLRVSDTGSGFRERPGLPPAASESGRGLFIVRALAVDVEIFSQANGSEVRAVLPVMCAAVAG